MPAGASRTGVHSAHSSPTARSPRSHPFPAMPTPLPCSATSRGRCVTRRASPRPAVRRGLAARRARAQHRARRRRVRRRGLGRAHRSARRRTAPGGRHPRQRGHLRRLVRLGQRRPIPPRPEPGAPVPETAWRVHLFAALLQPRRHRRDHAAGGRHPRRPVQALDRLERHRRTHRPAGVLRRGEPEEHRDQPRRHHRPPGPRGAAAVPRQGRPHRVDQPAAQRRRRRLPSGCPPSPVPTWRSCWRWPTCWPPRTSADREFLDTYCTGYERFERYLLGADDGVPKSPQWAAAICGRRRRPCSTALARRMAAQPHDRHRQLVAAARCATASRPRGWG